MTNTTDDFKKEISANMAIAFKAIAEASVAQANLTKRIDGLVITVDGLGKTVDGLGKTVDGLGKTVDKMGQKIDKLTDEFGGYTNREGRILENEFLASMQEAKRIGHIALDFVEVRVKNHREYDLVGVNGQAVVVGEVKRHVQASDVEEFAVKVSHHFAEDFPQYVRPEVYGMVAGEDITDAAKKMARKYGLFIIRLQHKALVVENAKYAKPLTLARG